MDQAEGLIVLADHVRPFLLTRNQIAHMVLGRQVFVLGAYDAQYIDRRLFALSRFKRFCSRLFEPSVSEEGDSGHYAEAKMGQLAQQNGQSDDVKNFGRMLADDHSAAKRLWMRLNRWA